MKGFHGSPALHVSFQDQAIDRLHRLGQRRPVRAVRVVAERTVEERILEVQKQKRLIIEGALSKKSRSALGNESSARLT